MNLLKRTAVLTCLLGSSIATADIYQYADCDGNGTLLLTELDAEPWVDLSDMYLGCADLTFAYLNDADLSGAYLSFADLTHASLDRAYLNYAYLNYAYLNYADLSDASLSYAYLSGADLSGADLSDASLSYAYLSGADLSDAWLGDADLSGADLSGAILSGAILYYADLSGVDLSGAILDGTNLSDADLTGAILSGAILYYAHLSGAILSGADLSYANFWQTTTWSDATYDEDTIFPEGMDPDEYGLVYAGPPVTGACCLDDGTCSTVSEDDCVAAGGTYNGDNSDCDTVSCDTNTGACCFLKEFCYWECLELSEQDCMAEYAATWYGIGSRCDDVTCPDPCVGACCLGGSQCVLTVQALCEEEEGTFHAYEMCVDIECELDADCPGDLNGDGSVNILDLLLVINYWGDCL